jgi:hypothetical protein
MAATINTAGGEAVANALIAFLAIMSVHRCRVISSTYSAAGRSGSAKVSDVTPPQTGGALTQRGLDCPGFAASGRPKEVDIGVQESTSNCTRARVDNLHLDGGDRAFVVGRDCKGGGM